MAPLEAGLNSAPDSAQQATKDSSFPPLASFPPRQAQLVLRLVRTLENLGLGAGTGILLAVSGGADSTALAILMHLAAPRLGLNLSAITCNHGLRPEAEEETRQVAALCTRLGLPLTTVRLNVQDEAQKSGRGLEETGRSLRYEAIFAEMKRTGASLAATGHHARDLSEDILLRLTRGTGWPALGGMRLIDWERGIIRPLLHEHPQELRDFLAEAGVSFCEDASNRDLAFARNRMRHTVLPLLEAENPRLSERCAALSRLAELDASFFAQEIDKALSAHPWQESREEGSLRITLPKELLKNLPSALRLRLYLRCVQKVAGAHGGQARSTALMALETALLEGRGGKTFEMAGGILAELRHGHITFYSRMAASLDKT